MSMCQSTCWFNHKLNSVFAVTGYVTLTAQGSTRWLKAKPYKVQFHTFSILTAKFHKIHSNAILPQPLCSKWSFWKKFLHQNCLCIICRPTHSSIITTLGDLYESSSYSYIINCSLILSLSGRNIILNTSFLGKQNSYGTCTLSSNLIIDTNRNVSTEIVSRENHY